MPIQQWIAPQQNNLIDTFMQAEQIKGQRSQNAFNEAKAAELPYEREREEALNAANIGKAEAQTGKADAETKKVQLEQVRQKLELGGQLLNGVSDQQSYDQARAQGQAHDLDTSQMPAKYFPDWVEQTKQRGIKTTDLVDQKLAELNGQSLRDYRQASLGIARGHLGVARRRDLSYPMRRERC